MVELKKVLNNRTYIMGLACIVIMIFHSNLPALNENIIKSHLYIGVDIFLFLSGIGIAQSLNKCNDKKKFYKHRLDKILTVALPLIVVLSFLLYIYDNSFGTTEFYYQSSLLNFLLVKGNYPVFLWYIPAILIYYFISPIIYDFYTKRENNIKSLLSILIICAILILFTIPSGFLSHYSIMINRLPIYIIGLIYGIRIIENKEMNIWELFFWILAALVGCAIIYITSNHYSIFNECLKIISFIPITIVSSVLFANIIDYIKKKNRYLRFSFLNIIGKYTLAIYVTHEALLFIIKGILTKYNIKIALMENPYTYAIIVGIISITMSIIWTKFVNYIKNNNIKEVQR